MKSINKIMTLMLAVAAMAFTACSEKGADYEAASLPEGQQAYFSNTDATSILLNDGQNSFTYDVYRTNTTGDCSVTITKTTNDNIFTIPSSVTFKDGENKASFPVTFDFSYFKEHSDTDIPLSIALNSETTTYGNSTANINVKYAPWSEWYKSLADWKTAGYAAGEWPLSSTEKTGTYTYSQFFTGDDEGMPVYFRKSLTDPTKAQFKFGDDSWGWGYGIEFILDATKDGDIYKLVVQPQFIGYVHSSYGEVWVCDDVEYWVGIRQKYTEEDVNYDLYPCTYDPETGTFTLNLVYYVSAGYFGDGEEVCLLDGFVRKDYTLAMSYAGGYINGKDAGAIVNMSMGADVAMYRYAIASGVLSEEEAADIADKIYNEEITATESSESTPKLFSLAEDGDYTVVAVLYDDESNKVGTASYSFTYQYVGGAEETWTTKFLGTYTYTLYFGTDEEPYEDTGLELAVSDENANRYMIKGVFYGVDFIFEMNEDNTLSFESQSTGYHHPTYDEDVMVTDYNEYAGTTSNPSYYDEETSTFNFCLVYNISLGHFTYGYETFQLTDYANAKSYLSAPKAKDFTPKAWQLKQMENKAAKKSAVLNIKSKSLTQSQALNGLRVRK